MFRLFGFWPMVMLSGWVALAAWLGVAPATAGPPRTATDLVRSDAATLDSLYATGTVSGIPSGFLPGRPIYKPGTALSMPAARLVHPMWQGKFFNGDGTGHNKLFGIRAVPTKVYIGESWKDGGPAVIVDYADSWRMFRKVRDEFREVSPGLYLGLTYLRDCPEPELAIRFALQEKEPHPHRQTTPCSRCGLVSAGGR
jgi:hypothetical protein